MIADSASSTISFANVMENIAVMAIPSLRNAASGYLPHKAPSYDLFVRVWMRGQAKKLLRHNPEGFERLGLFLEE